MLQAEPEVSNFANRSEFHECKLNVSFKKNSFFCLHVSIGLIMSFPVGFILSTSTCHIKKSHNRHANLAHRVLIY